MWNIILNVEKLNDFVDIFYYVEKLNNYCGDKLIYCLLETVQGATVLRFSIRYDCDTILSFSRRFRFRDTVLKMCAHIVERQQITGILERKLNPSDKSTFHITFYHLLNV